MQIEHQSDSMKVMCAHDEIVDIDMLIPNPRNPNKHPDNQIKLLAKIMAHQGWRSPIVVSNRSGFVVKGHGRLIAACLNKWDQAPVDRQDYANEADEYADMVADNKIAELSDTDLSMVLSDVLNLGPDFDFDLLGIPDFKLPEEFEAQTDEDEVPEHVEPKTKLGDIYTLGRHRLMCGDSTSIDAVEKLMDGAKADITFTSPPYNAAKNSSLKNKDKYLNDSDDKSEADYLTLLKDVTTNSLMHSKFVFVNIQSLSGNKTALIEYLHDMKSNYADTMIWDKESAEPAMVKNCMNSQFEYIHIFSSKANRIIGTKEFRGTVSNLYRHRSRSDKEFSEVHKATFPVSFAEYFVETFSNSSVLEPFGGSGSTLIACEKTGRSCFMMELDPHYCDVIVARWEKYTGRTAELLNEQ